MAGRDSFTIEFRAVSRNIERLIARLPEAAEEILREEAEAVLLVSREQFTPLDEGSLRASGEISDVEREGDTLSIGIGFGGTPESEGHALAIHQHPSEHSPHNWTENVSFSPAGTGPRYLELPLIAAAQDMGNRVAESLTKKLGEVVETGGS